MSYFPVRLAVKTATDFSLSYSYYTLR